MPKSRPGELNPKAKLTAAEVTAIRLSRLPNTVLATQYRVTPCTIGEIRANETWRHVPMPERVDIERWKPVSGFETRYEVSDQGEIRSLFNYANRTRPHKVDRAGYHFIALIQDIKRTHVRVHRVVMEAFNGPCPEGKQVNHIDGVKA